MHPFLRPAETRSRPTALGEELASYGRSIRATTQQISDLAGRVATGQQGEIRVGAPPFHSQRVASGFIAGWLERHPDIRIVLRNGYAPDLLTQLVEGNLDIIMAPVDVIEGIPNLIVERLTGGERDYLPRRASTSHRRQNHTGHAIPGALDHPCTRQLAQS